MAMQINGNYDPSGSGYAEKMKEKQAADRGERAKEADRADKAKETDSAAKPGNADRLSEPQDAYISSKKSGEKPTGLYRIVQDENGSRKIFYDDPKAEKNNREDPEKCVSDTNAVDREIRKLKGKKQQLEQQIHSVSGDEKKIRELKNKLAQVEQELSQKDNDTYRRQHSVFSQVE